MLNLPALLKILRYFMKDALHRIIVYTPFLGKTFCDADELPAAVLLFRLYVARRYLKQSMEVIYGLMYGLDKIQI